jgi:hypothetical protein
MKLTSRLFACYKKKKEKERNYERKGKKMKRKET